MAKAGEIQMSVSVKTPYGLVVGTFAGSYLMYTTMRIGTFASTKR